MESEQQEKGRMYKFKEKMSAAKQKVGEVFGTIKNKGEEIIRSGKDKIENDAKKYKAQLDDNNKNKAGITLEQFEDVKNKLKDANYNIEFDDFKTIKSIDNDYLLDIISYAPNVKAKASGSGPDGGPEAGVEDDKAITFFDYLWFIMANSLYFFMKGLKNYIEYITYFLGKINEVQYTYYELFLNIFFICLIFIILMIMYWDYVYRSANQLSRCTKIRDIVDENLKSDYPFIYYVMIVHEENIDNILDKYIIRLEYNFFKKTTKINYGTPEYYKDVILELTDDRDMKKAFTYYDLDEMNYKMTERSDDNNVIEYLDNSIITSVKYKYVVMTPTFKVLNDDASLELAKFVKQFGRDKDSTHLYPIYNILNAVEQHNIKNF